MTSDYQKPSGSSVTRFALKLVNRVVIILLLVVIGGMLIVWKPWVSARLDQNRTIKVTGETKLKAEPDEYVFDPSYEFKDADKQAALNQLTKKSDEIVKKLKDLGVTDNNVKTNANGNNYSYYYNDDLRLATYSLHLTVMASSREQAQKIQDYLVTTSPLGAVTPNAGFSETKKKELQNKARDEATKDARAKAEQSARNLGFKLDKVKSVEDGTGFNNIYPVPMTTEKALDSSAGSAPRLSVQPGENDLSYSVTVVYYFR